MRAGGGGQAECCRGLGLRCHQASCAARPCFRLPPLQCNPCTHTDYLEEDEDLDEEGLGEDLQSAQRQRMVAGRGARGYGDDDDEGAARLAAAKSGAGLPGGKRRRVESDEEEEAISGEEEEEGAEEMKVWSWACGWRGAWTCDFRDGLARLHHVSLRLAP